ncbi:MAG: hypothetical protein ABJF67_07995 [Aurantimonas coralicida]|uniref:hypothetical protein n=1 Tax=Aurantimonas coralicida TaxID=182270 RepID=UPI001D1860D6|nr:hypothetical protein [Aurantimonas coralicida]MCC4298401.1 hypothetical protein [Aurantimonas coralicida]
MNFFDFITLDEIDGLPGDDQQAFAEFVRIASGRLRDETRNIDQQDEQGWMQVQEAWYGFQNATLGAARRWKIEPFASLEMPKLADYRENSYRQFRFDLDHYIAQIAIDTSWKRRSESVLIPAKSKDRIRQHLHALREAVESSTMPEGRRSALLDRIEKLEAELERRRVSLLKIAYLTAQVLAIPGGLLASGDAVKKLSTNIMQMVGEAIEAEKESQNLPAPTPIYELSAPRTQESQEEPRRRSRPDPLDDEIPF